MDASADTQNDQPLEDSVLGIPYSVFTITKGGDKIQTLQTLARGINVQLALDQRDDIPFVAPTKFQLASSQDKLFLYGPGGSGKSRLIYELVQSTIDEKVSRLYVINPRHGRDKEIHRVNLMQLASQFSSSDIVVWDNFPDGLIKKDIYAGRLALEILSSANERNLFVALKPKLLEIYREMAQSIPDLYAYQIRYDMDQFKEIVKLYGTSISQFKELYTNHVADDISSIAGILWQKEPFPLTVFNYYRELAPKQNSKEQPIDALAEAHAMLYPISYYEHQFEQLVNSEARIADVDFLYTIKLCYDLGLNRKTNLVEHLQSRIFGSTPPKDIARNLGSWAYLSGRHVSIHDVPRDAIKFNDQTRARVIDYLITNFSEIISDRSDQLDSIGLFLGRNMQWLVQDGILPNHIYQFMKSHRRLEIAIGRGVGEMFYSFEQPLQQDILNRTEKDGEFSRGLGESLGNKFVELDANTRTEILSNRIGKSLLFARGLGESLGQNFKELPKHIRDEVFQIALKEKNYNFQRGVGTGLGHKFRHLEEDIQKHLLALTSQHVALAIGVGYGLALDYTSSSISRDVLNGVMELVKENGEIARGRGMGLGQNFPFLNRDLQNEILSWTESDPRLEFGFAYQLSVSFTSLTNEYQELIFNRIERHSEFSYGSGWGFGVIYTYLLEDVQQRLLDHAKKNMRFAMGLGAGIGNQLQYLTKDEEEELFSIIKDNEGLATGAAFGIGRSFALLREELQNKAWHLMQKDYGFAVGLGWGLGFAFSYLHESLQDKLLEYIQKEAGFAQGFGWSLGFMFTHLSADLKQKTNRLAFQNNQFAFGLGVGLGSLFNYLRQELRQEVLERAESNPQFATGLGLGVGYLFSYLPTRLQEDFLSRSNSDRYFARGLGKGLGDIFAYLQKERQQYLLQKAQRNPELLQGLGQGLGRIFAYLSVDQRHTTVKMASTSMHFAFGLGEAIGHGFQHLDKELKQWTIQLSYENDAIAKGLGSGLGRIIGYLDRESVQEVWRQSEDDTQFAMGLGEAIGEIIGFLSPSLQNEVFARAEQNGALSRGLGFGLGNCSSLYLTNNDLFGRISAYVKKSSDFSRGYGEGLGCLFNFWTKPVLNDIIMTNMATNRQFPIGLGEGAGRSMPYVWQFAAKERIDIDAAMEKLLSVGGFSYGFGLGFSRIIDFVSDRTRTLILQALLKFQNFAFGLGYGLGRSFPELHQKSQQDFLAIAENEDAFAVGFGHGIGSSFKYFEPVVQHGLLQFAETNPKFDVGFGHGIANIFPSLNRDLQEEVLGILEKREGFARGLSQGLRHSLVYLDESLQKRLASSANIKEYTESPICTSNNDILAEFTRYDNDSMMLLNRHRHTGHKEHQESDLSKEKHLGPEILFSGRREKYCICYIDMMNSTKTSATLDDLQLSKYYSIFLNSMAIIAKNFGATIIKNAGDCLIYYFPTTADPNKQDAFRNVIECGITMISAHQVINADIFEQRLPPLNYRISSDYGKVEVARSSSSQTEDLFGSAMNVCAKINSKAPANGMVIGHDLYKMVSSAMAKEYDFERIGEYLGFKEAYPIYSVKAKQKRNILNPFRRREETILDSSFHKDTDDDSNGVRYHY